MRNDIKRSRILGGLGDGGVVLVQQKLVDRPPKPSIEKMEGELRDGRRAPVWLFELLGHTRRMILPPVSVGCQLRKCGEARGWRTGCKFCAIGRIPFERYLEPEEILGFIRLALERGQLAEQYWTGREKNLVVFFSSAGEPLLCYDSVAKTIRRLKVIFGDNLYVSISTAGIAGGIRRLFEDNLRVQLRLSLHFSTDERRREFMPVPIRDDIKRLLDLGVAYSRKSKIPLMVKYVLIEGINDSDGHAQMLAERLKPYKEHIWVRVSRLNRYGGELRAPTKERRRRFVAVLRQKRYRVVRIHHDFATLGCDVPHFAE